MMSAATCGWAAWNLQLLMLGASHACYTARQAGDAAMPGVMPGYVQPNAEVTVNSYSPI